MALHPYVRIVFDLWLYLLHRTLLFSCHTDTPDTPHFCTRATAYRHAYAVIVRRLKPFSATPSEHTAGTFRWCYATHAHTPLPLLRWQHTALHGMAWDDPICYHRLLAGGRLHTSGRHIGGIYSALQRSRTTRLRVVRQHPLPIARRAPFSRCTTHFLYALHHAY